MGNFKLWFQYRQCLILKVTLCKIFYRFSGYFDYRASWEIEESGFDLRPTISNEYQRLSSKGLCSSVVKIWTPVTGIEFKNE